MGKYRRGAIIRLMRNSLGLTQEDLIARIDKSEIKDEYLEDIPDDDLCSLITLSRMENGKQKISAETFNFLMDKMGSTIRKTEPFLSTYELWALQEKDMMHIARVNKDYEKAEEILNEICRVLDLRYPLNKQFYIENKAHIDYNLGRIDIDTYLKKLEEAIKCTIRRFDEIDMGKWPYTVKEAVIVMNMAKAYGKKDGEEEAIKRLYELKSALEQGYMDKHTFATIWLSVVKNLASSLGNVEEFEKSIELDLKGIELSIEAENGGALAGFIYDIMWNNKELMKIVDEDEEKIKEMEKYNLKKAYHIARAMNDNVRIGFYKKKIEKL